MVSFRGRPRVRLGLFSLTAVHRRHHDELPPHPLTTRLTPAEAQEGPTPARLWGDHWLRVLEKLQTGIVDRLAACHATLVEIARSGAPRHGDEERRALAELSSLVELFGLLPAEPALTTGEIRLEDFLPRVRDLFALHPDLHAIPVELAPAGVVEPILVRQTALLRSLLVLIANGAGAAGRASPSPWVRLAWRQSGAEVALDVDSPHPANQLLFSGSGSLVHLVRSALIHAMAKVDAETLAGPDSQIVRYTITFPTAVEAHRRERDALG